jgi:hypothetical protein
MRIIAAIAAAVFVLLTVCSSAGAATIWSDGFESGNFSAWTSAAGNWAVVASTLSAHNGVKGADIKGATDPSGDMLIVRLSSAGFQNLEWQYWYKVRDGLELADSVFAEWSPNATDWFVLAQYNNVLAGDWQFTSFTLPATANEDPSLSFRFRAILGTTTDRMNFDDFTLTGVATAPEPSSLVIFFSCLFFTARKLGRKA